MTRRLRVSVGPHTRANSNRCSYGSATRRQQSSRQRDSAWQLVCVSYGPIAAQFSFMMRLVSGLSVGRVCASRSHTLPVRWLLRQLEAKESSSSPRSPPRVALLPSRIGCLKNADDARLQAKHVLCTRHVSDESAPCKSCSRRTRNPLISKPCAVSCASATSAGASTRLRQHPSSTY